MTTTTTVSETDRQLAAMFTENTGRHILDSGGAYGRNWERNQGRDVQSFLDAPEASFEVWSEDDWYCTVDTFHFLRERLEWDQELNDELEAYAELRPDDNWFAIAEGFPAYHAELHGQEVPVDGSILTVNTYNHENTLDQVIQYIQVSEDGNDAIYPDYIVLQVHGGCDVRGGYTAPKVFRSAGWGEVGLLDNNRLGVRCVGVEPSPDDVLPGFTKPELVNHGWYSDDAGYNWYSENGECDLTREGVKVDDDKNLLCPECGARLEVYPY
jgi:hypothetical protein